MTRYGNALASEISGNEPLEDARLRVFRGDELARRRRRYAAMLRFVVQALGLGLAVIMSSNLLCVYIGFFLYGIGLGGNMVLPDILWADYFGRLSLGQIRGMGILISQVLAAIGPPFFGFLFDITGGYGLSFTIFGIVLMISAILSLMLRRPRKRWSDGVLE